jgi:hypothetical protein
MEQVIIKVSLPTTRSLAGTMLGREWHLAHR